MELLATRTVDELGRIALPLETRQELDWRENTTVDIYKFDGDTLVLRRNPAALTEKELDAIGEEIKGIDTSI